MTQKELLYFEDAIGHENNIIKIINNTISSLSDEELTTFMQEEVTKHENLKEKLMDVLKEASNG